MAGRDDAVCGLPRLHRGHGQGAKLAGRIVAAQKALRDEELLERGYLSVGRGVGHASAEIASECHTGLGSRCAALCGCGNVVRAPFEIGEHCLQFSYACSEHVDLCRDIALLKCARGERYRACYENKSEEAGEKIWFHHAFHSIVSVIVLNE